MTHRSLARRARIALLAALVPAIGLAGGAAAAAAQEQAVAPGARPLSLEDALRMAERTSETVGIARAGVDRARGEQLRARSELFPQLSGSVGYTRTLASEFEGLSTGDPDTRPFCRPFVPPAAGATSAERLDSLEAGLALNSDCQQSGGGIDFSNLPFGRTNAWRLGLNASQTLFSGGRVLAQTRIAGAGRQVAEIGLASARAQTVLDVVQAYYDAALSDRLVNIARATLQQAETTFVQTRLALQVGNAPEFDLLRAQVTRDNQRPVLVQRLADREVAYLRLKQLLEIPLQESLALTTVLDDSTAVPTAASLTALAGTQVDTSSSARAPVRQAEQAVRVQEGLLRVARSQRLPAVALTSQYGRVAYPAGGVPEWNSFRENWTLGVSLSLPLFTGGRIRGDEIVAQANLAEQKLTLDRTRELAQLETGSALAEMAAAEASFSASAGTTEQAARAYQIAEVRYREGISTQTELSDSRILLQQAQANRALAARDLAVARARVALLRDLPLGSASARTAGAGSQGGAATQMQQQQPQQGTPQGQGQGQRSAQSADASAALTGAVVP